MADQVRYGLLLRTSMEVLRDLGGMRPKQLQAEVAKRVELNPAELATQSNGQPAWITAMGYHTGDAATVGWLVKRPDGWQLTAKGRQALSTYPLGDSLITEAHRQYRSVFKQRKATRAKYDSSITLLGDVLEGIPPGSWTAYEDLAMVLDAAPEEVPHLLADVALPNAFRVLNAAGEIPEARFQHATYRGSDLRARLAAEGVEFDELGHASQDQRIAGEMLRARLEEIGDEPARVRRAWLIRGSNVNGHDLIPVWLREGWCSIEASRLSEVDEASTEAELRQRVSEAYSHKDYSSRERLSREVEAFLRRMRPEDIALTVHEGAVILGLIDGDAAWTESEGGLSNLRRPVRWLNADAPIDLADLTAPLPALLASQDDVVDLTEALSVLERLVTRYTPVAPVTTTPEPGKPLTFKPVTAELADTLLLAQDWLVDLADLLWERKQIILHGPPGTGKTYLANKLARHLTDEQAVTLVQFHPSYSYEDFFEGYRPVTGKDGKLEFDISPGAFRRLADAARDHPSTPYILIIDEINRGNLAKIFGELYFLLEYRDQAITLQYQEKEFWLPENVFLIGTMNTADRSIALVDSAMRRRFAFEEMHPRRAPVAGLLRRWLARKGIDSDAPDLLDALNDQIEDPEYAIGPSYLMPLHIYRRPDGLERVWRTDLLPLLTEHHYGDGTDVAARYGLEALRAGLGRQSTP